MVSPSLHWLVLGALCMTVGCVKQEYGQCGPPNEDLQILFKAESGSNPFSHSFCIVCNPTLEFDDYQAWASEMGANIGPDIGPDMDTPCLYAYGADDELPNGFESLAQCQAAICEGSATYADFVSRLNGNIDLEPIIGPAEAE